VRTEKPAFNGLAEEPPLQQGCSEGLKGLEHPQGCRLGDRQQQPSFVLWGDSFANALWSALDQAAAQRHVNGYRLTLSMCPSITGVIWNSPSSMPYSTFAKDCHDYTAKAMEFVVNDPSIHTVVLTSSYYWYMYARNQAGESILTTDDRGLAAADEFKAMLQRLDAAGKHLVVVMPHPADKELFFAAVRRAYALGDTSQLTMPESTATPDPITAMIEGLQTRTPIDRIYPHRMMCSLDNCRVFDRDGDLFLSDGAHVTAKMAHAIVAAFPPEWYR
jgi:hypothetical protein